MNHFKLLSFLLLSFIFYQCNNPCKDVVCENNGICEEGICDCPEGTQGDFCEVNLNHKLKSIAQDGRLTLEFEYNSENQMSKRITYDNSSIKLEETVFKYEDNKVVERQFLPSVNSTYENHYSKESEYGIVKNCYYVNGSSLSFSGSHTYQFSPECGQLNQLSFRSDGVQLQITWSWVYDSSCNYVFTSLEQDIALDYIYDVVVLDRPNPRPTVFDFFNLEKFRLIDSWDYISYVDDPNGILIIEYTSEYEYNERGNPVKETRHYPENNEVIFTYEYYE